MRYKLGRLFQAMGIVVAPMAIFYYYDHERQTQEFGLGTMEWVILASAVLLFTIGRALERFSK